MSENKSRKRPGGLGRGLNALLGEMNRDEPLVARDSDADSATMEAGDAPSSANARPSGLQMLSLADIERHSGQPRQDFDEQALEELARSIRQRGVIQPIIVRPAPKSASRGRYQIVAGERRWRAAQRARLHQIPAIVRDLDDQDTMALALIENIQRENLNPVEEALAYQNLVEGQGQEVREVAELVNKSRSHVSNMMRLLALPEDVLDLVRSGSLSMGHARALINCDNARELADEAVEQNLSVRELEKMVRRQRNQQSGAQQGRSDTARHGHAANSEAIDLAAVEQQLEDALGLRVQIRTSASQDKGSVTVHFGSLDQFDLVLQRLSGEGI